MEHRPRRKHLWLTPKYNGGHGLTRMEWREWTESFQDATEYRMRDAGRGETEEGEYVVREATAEEGLWSGQKQVKEAVWEISE